MAVHSFKVLHIIFQKLSSWRQKWSLGSEVPESMLVTRILFILQRKFNHSFSRKEWHRPAKGDKERRNRVLNCYNCGRIGQKWKDCLGCYTCGSKSHISESCFKNKGRRNFQDGGTRSWQKKPNSEDNGGQRRGNRVAYVETNDVSDNDFWLIHSGASDHMTNRREWFCIFEGFPLPVDIKIGNGDSMQAYGKGNIEIDTF